MKSWKRKYGRVVLHDHTNKRARGHGRLPLVDAIISRRLAIVDVCYCLNKSCMVVINDRLNPYAATPPQVIRTMPLSHLLQLARQKQIRRHVLFVAAVAWICFVLWFSVCGMWRFYLEPARHGIHSGGVMGVVYTIVYR